MQPNEDNVSNGNGSNINSPKPMQTDNTNGEDSSFVLGKHSVISPITSPGSDSLATQAQPEVPNAAAPTPQPQIDAYSQPPVAAPVAPAQQPVAAVAENPAPQPFMPTPTPPAPQPAYTPQPTPAMTQPSMPQQPMVPNPQLTTPQSGMVMPEPQVYGAPGPVVSQPVMQGMSSMNAPIGTANAKRSSPAKMIIAVIALIVIVGGGATGFALWQKSQNSPAAVFKTAIANSLAASYMKEDLLSQGNTATILVDDSNPSQPKTDTQVNLNVFGINMTMEGYGTTSNGFLKVNMKKTGDAQIDNVLDKWSQVETNGQLAQGADSSTLGLVDPYQMILGQWVTGNFSSSQRSAFANYAVAQNVYNYDASKVTTGSVNGQPAYIYNITLNQNALKNYNHQVGQALGLKSSKIDDELTSSGAANVKSATVYILKGSKQIAKVDAVDPTDGNTSATYSFGSTVQFPEQPTAQITYSQFQTAFGGSLGGSSSSSSSTGN